MQKKYENGDMSWWAHDRFGMFIHWGIYSLPARHEWVKRVEGMTTADYQKYFDHFNPDLFDAKKWAKCAKKTGMKYFIITTKHHDGFCMWDSKYTDYKITNTPIKRDLLREVIDAYRAEGLKIGLYYSLLDWHHPEFIVDCQHSQFNVEEEYEKNKLRDPKVYPQYMRDQVRELLTEYGKIDIMWFDFSYSEMSPNGKGCKEWEGDKMVNMIREISPDTIINNRIEVPGLTEIETIENFLPDNPPVDEDGTPKLWESCQTFSGSWGYHRDESTWKSSDMLIELLINIVSSNGNLLLNVGPTSRGTFDQRAKSRFDAVGEWMEFHSRSIYGCQHAPEEFKAPKDCRYTYNPETKCLYLHLFTWPFKHVTLEGLGDKIEYAQLLNDGSEVIVREHGADIDSPLQNDHASKGDVIITLPAHKPDVTVPVVEMFLK